MESVKAISAQKLLNRDGNVPDKKLLSLKMIYSILEAYGYVYNKKMKEWRLTNAYRKACHRCGSINLKYAGIMETYTDGSRTVMFKCLQCGNDTN